MKENAADAIKDVETRHASALQQMQVRPIETLKMENDFEVLACSSRITG